MTNPAVGPITALTWALEVGDVKRFSSIKKAISYCGLCGAEKSSLDTIKRTPISKQRNKHLLLPAPLLASVRMIVSYLRAVRALTPSRVLVCRSCRRSFW